MSAETPLIDIRPDHWAIVRRILQKHVPQYAVWAFGSRAKWSAKEYSDLDLAVITDKPLPLSIRAALDEDFSESDLPWKVDVVDWASTNASFQKIIEKDKVVVQEARVSGHLLPSERDLSMANEWPTVRIEDIAEKIAMGPFGSNIKVETFVETGVPVISGTHLHGIRLKDGEFNFVTDKHAEKMKNSNVFRGDVIFTHAGNIGQIAYIPPDSQYERYVISQRQFYLRCDLSKADPAFVSYFFHSNDGQHKLLANASQTGVPSIARPSSYLKTIELSLPPLTEQRTIAHILGTLDDKIELNRKQNETLEAMARALFKAWFVDFEPVHAKMEGRWQRGQSLPGLPAHLYDLFPDRLVESELGEIPEGWGVEAYSDAVEIIGGGTPKTSVDEYWNGEIPWFSVVDTPASSDVFVVSTEKSITQAGFENSSVKMAEKGVTIISARGTVGNLAIAGREMTFNQSCYALRGKSGFGSYFVFLSAQHMVEQLKAMAHGSVFSTITRQTFDAVKVVRPSEALLFQFERVVASLFDAILGNVNESRTLAQLRDTLLPKLISGELRVLDASVETLSVSRGAPVPAVETSGEQGESA